MNVMLEAMKTGACIVAQVWPTFVMLHPMSTCLFECWLFSLHPTHCWWNWEGNKKWLQLLVLTSYWLQPGLDIIVMGISGLKWWKIPPQFVSWSLSLYAAQPWELINNFIIHLHWSLGWPAALPMSSNILKGILPSQFNRYSYWALKCSSNHVASKCVVSQVLAE